MLIILIKIGVVKLKILVCTDGSEHSQKVLEKASLIAQGCTPDEVSVIYVYDDKMLFPIYAGYTPTQEEKERFRKYEQMHKEEKKMILSEALKTLENKNIKANAIFEEGHPAETIVRVASEQGFDMIIIGSRGMGGLKRLFLGSVSNAVVHNAKVSVLTVK